MNKNEGTMYVDDMIPGVTFQTIENNPEYAYNRAVEELVKERVNLWPRDLWSHFQFSYQKNNIPDQSLA